jgi:hypothetical protein
MARSQHCCNLAPSALDSQPSSSWCPLQTVSLHFQRRHATRQWDICGITVRGHSRFRICSAATCKQTWVLCSHGSGNRLHTARHGWNDIASTSKSWVLFAPGGQLGKHNWALLGSCHARTAWSWTEASPVATCSESTWHVNDTDPSLTPGQLKKNVQVPCLWLSAPGWVALMFCVHCPATEECTVLCCAVCSASQKGRKQHTVAILSGSDTL